MLTAPTSVGAVSFCSTNRRLTHWSEARIMEVGAFIAFHYGMLPTP